MKSQKLPLKENSGGRRKLICDHGNISYLYIEYHMPVMPTAMLEFCKLKNS